MAESDFQREPLMYAVESLRIHFRDRPDVYVSGIERNYWPLPVQERSGSDLRMHSAVLGLDLRLDEGQLRFHDPATGERLRSHAESELARRAAELRRQAAEQASQAADQARQHAEARAEEELRQCRALEARLAELEQRLQQQ
jgi:hypothetical protein